MGSHYSTHLLKYKVEILDVNDAERKKEYVITAGLTDYSKIEGAGTHAFVQTTPLIIEEARQHLREVIQFYYTGKDKSFLDELEYVETTYGPVASRREAFEYVLSDVCLRFDEPEKE